MSALEKIKELIGIRNAGLNKFNSERKAICENWLTQESRDTYDPNYIVSRIYDSLDEIDTREEQAFTRLNSILKEEMSKVRNSLQAKYYPPFNKASDLQIANALTLINTFGREITENDCAMILAPFNSDYEQMLIFQRVINLQNEGLVDCDAFTKTNIYTKKLITLEQANKIANTLFINNRMESEGTRFNERWFTTVYADTYTELDGQMRIVQLIDEIEADTQEYIG